ncbi:YdcF family protein [bacterium]|nr:YdcF family protein [bacterium]
MNFWKCLEQRLETKNDRLPRHADVIIGIGIDVAKDGIRPSSQSKAVAETVSRLFRRGLANNILLVGGHSKNHLSLTEAKLMCRIVSRRVPSNRIIIENKSLRTWENADLALPIMKQHGWNTAIVVAQQWHARRVRATLKKRWSSQKIKFVIIKAPSSYGGGSQRRLDSFWRFAIWDTLAFILSKFKGYI